MNTSYTPQYFAQYFKLKNTGRNNWFEPQTSGGNKDISNLLKFIEPITWAEIIQPRISAFQIDVTGEKTLIRFAFKYKPENFWLGKFKHSDEISFLLIKSKSTIEIFYSYKYNYMELLKLFNSGKLKTEIKYFRLKNTTAMKS